MPYREIHRDVPRADPSLVAEIAEELRRRQETGDPEAPLVIQEDVPRTDYVHVTVIWDRWGALPAEERGRIILEAYEQARGVDAAQAISIAVGLTRDQARRLGLENGIAAPLPAAA